MFKQIYTTKPVKTKPWNSKNLPKPIIQRVHLYQLKCILNLGKHTGLKQTNLKVEKGVRFWQDSLYIFKLHFNVCTNKKEKKAFTKHSVSLTQFKYTNWEKKLYLQNALTHINKQFEVLMLREHNKT